MWNLQLLCSWQPWSEYQLFCHATIETQALPRKKNFLFTRINVTPHVAEVVVAWSIRSMTEATHFQFSFLDQFLQELTEINSNGIVLFQNIFGANIYLLKCWTTWTQLYRHKSIKHGSRTTVKEIGLLIWDQSCVLLILPFVGGRCYWHVRLTWDVSLDLSICDSMLGLIIA